MNRFNVDEALRSVLWRYSSCTSLITETVQLAYGEACMVISCTRLIARRAGRGANVSQEQPCMRHYIYEPMRLPPSSALMQPGSVGSRVYKHCRHETGR